MCHAFGNYKEFLREVAYSPMMGEFFSHIGSKKAFGNNRPDENFSREFMQLFTVGTKILNIDGTEQQVGGSHIPTYYNTNIDHKDEESWKVTGSWKTKLILFSLMGNGETRFPKLIFSVDISVIRIHFATTCPKGNSYGKGLCIVCREAGTCPRCNTILRVGKYGPKVC